MGSRAGLIAPDDTTFAYLKDREYAPKGEAWDKAVEEWRKLKSDDNAIFDKEVTYRAEDRTLTDDEVDEVHGDILQMLRQRFGAVLRER